jgi:hypothetical protein
VLILFGKLPLGTGWHPSANDSAGSVSAPKPRSGQTAHRIWKSWVTAGLLSTTGTRHGGFQFRVLYKQQWPVRKVAKLVHSLH